MSQLVTAVIRTCRKRDHDPKRPERKQKWCLYTHDGKKLLGRHPSKARALRQERAIQVHKHGTVTEQSQRASAMEEVKMATKKDTPEVVSYMGHLYVAAGDDEPMEDALDDMAEDAMEDDLPAPDGEMEEEMEEVELVDALKEAWQVVLDRLPDDLEVDEDFESALDTIEEVIKVMDAMHAEYAAEQEGAEPEGEGGEEEPPEELEED